MKLYFFLFLFIAQFAFSAHAQRMDNTAIYRQVASDSHQAFLYENDLFVGTDEYYSQGASLELVMPWLRKNPINRLLLHFSDSIATNHYGLAAEINAYTPTRLLPAFVLEHDRPYAATVSLKSFRVSFNAERKERLLSTLVLGALGPIALGKEIQTAIHKTVGGIIPLGWDNQVKNSLLVNYKLNLDKQLFAYSTKLRITVNTSIQTGTYCTKLQAGTCVQTGKLGNLFQPTKASQWYVYSQVLLSAVAHDATLQGSFLRKDNPHTVSAKSLNRIGLENYSGIVFQSTNWLYEAFFAIQSQEFKEGKQHSWAGISLARVF